MPADRNDLDRRVAATTPADTSRGLNYTSMFALVRDELGDAAVRAIDVRGSGKRSDFLSYPIAEYLACAWNVIDRLEDRYGGPEGVLHELGRRTFTAFLNSMIGRTVYAIHGRDPARILSTAATSYRAAVSYGERTTEHLGPKVSRITFIRDFMPPAFHRAVILTAMQATEARRPRVTATAASLLDSVYEVEWE